MYMLFKHSLSFTALLLTLVFAQNTVAETRYIDDTLRVPMRSGASSEHRIISFVISGTKVDEQPSDQPNEEWAFVKLANGTEGWIQRTYLKNTPAAKELLAYSQNEVAALKQKNSEQLQEIKKISDELKEIKKQLTGLEKHSEKTDKELAYVKDISKDVVRIDTSNTQLLEENELLKASREESQQLVTKLESNQKNQGIIYGVLAVLLGIFLGWIMPKMKSNRSSDWT